MTELQTCVGIDASLKKTGVIILCTDGQHRSEVITTETENRDISTRFARYNRSIREVVELAQLAEPAVICIEGYSYGHGNSDLIEHGAILRLRLLSLGFEIYEVAPTTLKKHATGKGSGDKTGVIAAVTKRYGVMFESNDEYDAYALARIGMQIKGFEQPANQIQAECIETIVNGAKPKPKKSRKRATT